MQNLRGKWCRHNKEKYNGIKKIYKIKILAIFELQKCSPIHWGQDGTFIWRISLSGLTLEASKDYPAAWPRKNAQGYLYLENRWPYRFDNATIDYGARAKPVDKPSSK